jgi:hypothetical protein
MCVIPTLVRAVHKPGYGFQNITKSMQARVYHICLQCDDYAVLFYKTLIHRTE